VRIGVNIPHEKLIKVLLNGLLDSYDNLVQNILASDKLPTFEKLASKPLHEEGRRSLKETTQVDEAIYVKTKHYQNKSIDEREKNIVKKNVVCYKCNEIGHISRFNKKPLKKWNNATKERDKKNAQISILGANLATRGSDTNEKVLGDTILQDFKTHFLF